MDLYITRIWLWYLKVVKDSEVESLLYMLYTHSLGHLGVEKVLEKVKRKYY